LPEKKRLFGLRSSESAIGVLLLAFEQQQGAVGHVINLMCAAHAAISPIYP